MKFLCSGSYTICFICVISSLFLFSFYSMESKSKQRGRGQNKCYWTEEEDAALIDALVEVTTNPIWRAENGFLAGYLNQLERMIKEKNPKNHAKGNT